MKLILACDPKGGIGYKNKLPWDKIQGDLPRFKQLTNGQIVVMGRNTWDSLPKKPLLNRLNFILTSQNLMLPNGAIAVPNLNHFSEYKNVWLIGGASVVNSHWHMIETVHLTRTFTTYTCDTFIDLVQLQIDFTLSYDEVNSDHTYEIWTRR